MNYISVRVLPRQKGKIQEHEEQEGASNRLISWGYRNLIIKDYQRANGRTYLWGNRENRVKNLQL